MWKLAQLKGCSESSQLYHCSGIASLTGQISYVMGVLVEFLRDELTPEMPSGASNFLVCPRVISPRKWKLVWDPPQLWEECLYARASCNGLLCQCAYSNLFRIPDMDVDFCNGVMTSVTVLGIAHACVVFLETVIILYETHKRVFWKGIVKSW